LLAAENLPAAIAELQRALRLDPGLERARFLTGRAWAEAGEAEKALAVFSELDAETPGLKESLAKLEAMKGAARSDPGYVRHLFDQFAPDYDNRMRGELAYAAPEILRELFEIIGAPGMRERPGPKILDLGCGTGLCGEAFRPLAVRLDGVDLSPAMVAKARARGVYDSLMVADIETALALAGPRYDPGGRHAGLSG
jgi:predicted TPR repeat methyltransferase